MKDKIIFRKKVEDFIASLDEKTFAYNKDEYWMIFSTYEFLEYYSFENKLWNTCIALPLARGLHDGTYRKSSISKNGSIYRLPYVIHCLKVCRMLADLNIPLSKDEEDILLAAALCHDMVEDLEFERGGMELIENYHLDPRVLEVVKLVTKRKDFTDEEEAEHFRRIKENKLALLIKLSDRSHNVEDLYNMSVQKVHEYVDETNKFILPMCDYGIEHYPELVTPIGILEDKIKVLTHSAETLVDRYHAREMELRDQLKELRMESEKLFIELNQLWER